MFYSAVLPCGADMETFMRILHITAQKPMSTGSGVYLSELVRAYASYGHDQGVVGGVYPEDPVDLPEGVRFFPVYFMSEELPFPICGMSDEMPYRSTRYCDMTKEMVEAFRAAFSKTVKKAVSEIQPDLIICHHLYLLTAYVRELFPDRIVCGFCHNTDLRQMQKHDLERERIAAGIRDLDAIFALKEEQRGEIAAIYGADAALVEIVGAGYNPEIFHLTGKSSGNDSVQTDEAHILYVGKISEKKGVKSLLKSLAYLDLPEKRIVLDLVGGAGDREEYEEITALAGKLPQDVVFHGKVDQEKLVESYRAADVFALPSFSEGMPLTMIESLAMGCKVVVSDLPGLRPFMEENAPGAQIWYVALPPMNHVDEAEESELPYFERRIADALFAALRTEKRPPADLSRLTWRGIADRVLNRAADSRR